MRLALLACLAALAGCGSTSSSSTGAVVVEPGSPQALPPDDPAPQRTVGAPAQCGNALALGLIDEHAPLSALRPVRNNNVMSPELEGGSAFFAVKGPAPDPRAGSDDPLEVRIEGPASVASGAPLPLRAFFANRTSAPVTLVRPLDGSFERMRFPTYDLYAHETATGQVYRFAFVGGRCGNVNPVHPEDLVTLTPGQDRDDVTTEGWASHLQSSTISRPGRYKVWLVYSFCGFDDDAEAAALAGDALVGVHASNAIDVEVR